MKQQRVLVLGGGAAGFFGAIAAAESNSRVKVTVLEAAQTPLAKVRISGGGRCNVTHACFEPAQLVQHYPRGGKALRGAFSRFQPRDTIAWFNQHGVALKTEADGRMFPTTDDSGTIVDCLMTTARQAGVELYTGASVVQVMRVESGFEVLLRGGKRLTGDVLLLATGSNPQGYQIAKSLGHTIVPPVPSLFTFNVPDPQLRSLAGVAVDKADVQLRLPDVKPLEQTGPLLVTHWGLSGPAILKLSAWGARLLQNQQYQATVVIHWLPPLSLEAVRQKLLSAKAEWSKRAIAAHNPFPLPRRLWQYLTSRAGIAPEHRWADLSKSGLHALTEELVRGQYPVKGKGVFKDEFVTCGGIPLNEVDFKTMESRCCPGLYLAGEVLDIDGVTGGFNFQSAWTTGWIAGGAIAKAHLYSDCPPVEVR